ncbi:hypothetical protein Gorai_000412, partial [Gossypium raimondii]|nr:hypothetical protein [Gossypium raimondii]
MFGDSPTIIQNSLLIVWRPMDNQFNTIIAQGKEFIDENTDIFTLGDFIRPKGWMHFEGLGKVNFEETLYYVEYNNHGLGAKL